MPHNTIPHGSVDRRDEPIAIVGMACNLAGGVDSPSTFWQTLINGEIKQSERIPESRFNIDAYFHEDAFGRPAAIGSKGGFFLNTKLDTFDAEFFGYDSDEAKHMDPQHFRVLETVYECLESAGKTLDHIRGSNTAVFIGNFSLDKVISSARHSYDDRHLHEVIGIDPGLLSSRVSYCYDLNGPVFTTNTGCTSSLFALHTAAMALRGGECPAAIVGGVNLLQGPEAYVSYSKFGIMSPDSMCHPYDARCNGYVRAEGVGALYVKLLADAIRDNDPIRGVVRSIAVNSNGSVPGMPLFVPNEKGLAKSMSLAYAQANLNPAETAYVETHGIGMVLGEIAEAKAVGTFMNQPQRRPEPVRVGALKTNFGHQEAASGVFVLMKAAMMTEAGIIPGHVNFKNAHPAIDLEKLNIKPQTETINWPANFPARRVGFCSYGWSGTNVHGLVESVHTLHPEYKLGQMCETAGYDHSVSRPLLLTLSAFKQSSLRENVDALRKVADKYYPADLAYTLNTRRSKFTERAFTIINVDGGSSAALDTSHLRVGSAVGHGDSAKVAFTFSESRIDLIPLARELLQHFTVFATSMAKMDVDLENLPRADQAVSVNTAVQVALVDLFIHWNIRPSVVVRQGEASPAAKYAAGIMSVAEINGAGQGDDEEVPRFPSIPLVVDGDREAQEAAVMIPIGSSHNLRALLSLVGEIYLSGHPADLERVNEIQGATWEPKFVVDLPHYVWDHTKSYSSETHANMEHHQNKHPYHELLGRRVHGLSPTTMIWKNKLSFKDLPDSIPWVPNPKPLTIHGSAYFLSTVAEALVQGFDNYDLKDFTITDFTVNSPLTYHEDCDLIECQTSISETSPGVYRIAIDSVKEHTWSKHCEGTLTITRQRSDSPTDGAMATVESKATGKVSKTDSPTLQFDLDAQLAGTGQKHPSRYHLHPILVDAALRTTMKRDISTIDDAVAQSNIGVITILQTQNKAGGLYAICRSESEGSVNVQIASSDTGEVMLKLVNVCS